MTHLSAKGSVIFNYTLPCIYFFWVSSISTLPTIAQVQQLNGTMDLIFAEVLAIDPVFKTFEIANPQDFTEGEKVLIIKIQGAKVDEAHDATFGDVADDNSVGLFEITTICSILGNQVSFNYELANDYAPNGNIEGNLQMIKIPIYEEVEVVGPTSLTAPAWNGIFGGVLIFEATESVTLQADIDMSEKGFRGGIPVTSPIICNSTSVAVDSFFVNTEIGHGAAKGEGAATPTLGLGGGRGHLANGGGGGNFPYTGGGGGSNGGIGGKGGSTTQNSVCTGIAAGEPGEIVPVDVNNIRLFMGGGGGAGHTSTEADFSALGGNGGGIIILITPQIVGNGFAIRSNGGSPNESADGGAGGGGGGSIALSTDIFTNNLLIQASGGTGGNSSSLGIECQGPGGGGGGGIILSRIPIDNVNAQALVEPGEEGTVSITPEIASFLDDGISCGGLTNSASSGSFGQIIVINQFEVPQQTTLNTPCILSTEIENAHFDEQAVSEEIQLSIYPNPVTDNHFISVKFFLPEDGNIHCVITDMFGRLVYEQQADFSEGEHKISLRNLHLAKGLYAVSVSEIYSKVSQRDLITVIK